MNQLLCGAGSRAGVRSKLGQVGGGGGLRKHQSRRLAGCGTARGQPMPGLQLSQADGKPAPQPNRQPLSNRRQAGTHTSVLGAEEAAPSSPPLAPPFFFFFFFLPPSAAAPPAAGSAQPAACWHSDSAPGWGRQGRWARRWAVSWGGVCSRAGRRACRSAGHGGLKWSQREVKHGQ